MKNKKYFILPILLLIARLSIATPYNIASEAKIEASSSLPGYEASYAIDGESRIVDSNEWRSKSQQTFWGYIDNPWIKLTWDKTRSIERIILYDRPNKSSHFAAAKLRFSDGSHISINTIPNDGSPKVIDFLPKKIDWVQIECTDADGIEVGLSEIEIYPSFEEYPDQVSKVDPYIESAKGRYFFFVTGSQPFGMISAAPLTRNKNQYGGGYNYNSTEILGFPQIHDWMLSGLTLMPTVGEVTTKKGENGWKSNFSHDGEIVRPGYHKLFLDRYNIWVEQTSTDRVGLYRYTYCQDTTNADILINLGGYVSTTTMIDGEFIKMSDTEICGSFNTVGRLWGGPDCVKIFYTIKFDKPFISIDGWDDATEYKNITQLKGKGKAVAKNKGDLSYYDAPSMGARVKFAVAKGEKIQVKTAISFTSIANARKNMDSECKEWNFDTVAQNARKEWNDYLGKIEVKGGTKEQQIKFYTDLWHVLLGRHKIDDISGDYPDYTQGKRVGNFTKNARLIVRQLPKNKNGISKFHMYNSDAFWLTQWNLNVLWGLAWPEILDDFAACLVQYADNGGLLPRGPNAGGYSYIMSGCPATNLITCAFQKNMLTKVAPKHALKRVLENHKGNGMLGTQEEISFYETNGYYPNNAGATLEACFQDWSAANMASELGYKKEAAQLYKRSKGWEKLFHPKLKLIMPKNAQGDWLHENPFSGEGWIEANAWQSTWSISHDILRLGELMGGTDTIASKLNFAFEQSKDEDFVFGYGAGYVSYANQPGCSNAHVFNRIGKSNLSQYWVRRVNEQAYGKTTTELGYGGHDEDQGQMGAVSALMSIGLFSVDGTCSKEPVYDITSPVFDQITIQLNPLYYTGNKFIIHTHNNTSENFKIGKIEFNGKPVENCIIKHSELSKGGTLDIWLKNK